MAARRDLGPAAGAPRISVAEHFTSAKAWKAELAGQPGIGGWERSDRQRTGECGCSGRVRPGRPDHAGRVRLASTRLDAREPTGPRDDRAVRTAGETRRRRVFVSPPPTRIVVAAPNAGPPAGGFGLVAAAPRRRFPQGGNETEAGIYVPEEFDWLGFDAGLGSGSTDDPMFDNGDPVHWAESSPDAFPDRFLAWTEATIPPEIGGTPADCPSTARIITDPFDPIVFGKRGQMSLTIAAAPYQWFWVGAMRTEVGPGLDASFVVEVFASGYGGYGVDQYWTPSAGLSLQGRCVRARQTPVESSIEITISRGMYEDNGDQDIIMMIAGRTGSLW
jgi:hypothetical protein